MRRTSCSGSMSEHLAPRPLGLLGYQTSCFMELRAFGGKGSGLPLLPTRGGPRASLGQGELSPGDSAGLVTR